MKLIQALLSVLLGAASMALAIHHPLFPLAMAILVLVCCAAIYMRPNAWPLALPALLPVIGLAPWTGWITFEELDILILAVAAGGYAGLARPNQRDLRVSQAKHHRASRTSFRVWLIAGFFALATAVSIYRGFANAGGFNFGWYQGYHEPMNSVRVGKSFFLALVLIPLWQVAFKQDPKRFQGLLSLGLMLGLAAAALTTIWERAAFTDLLNFSADYRTTGMFWEMHVGGAALDGFLALTVPFALRELVVARSTLRWTLAATVLSLAAYACLTTFSRGVYLAVPTGTLVFFGLTARQGWQFNTRNSESLKPWQAVLAGLFIVAGFAGGAAWMFQSSGYRGMAALLSAVALMLPLAQVLRSLKASRWLAGLAAGMLLMMISLAVTWLVPKGAYIVWGLATIFTAFMLWLCRRTTPTVPFAGAMAIGGFLATVAGTAMVATHWGGYTGLRHATPVLLGVLGVCVLAGLWRKPIWPELLRWQATTAGVMGLAAAVVGVMGGGAYMSDRFSTGGKDLDVRLAHWQLGRSMLQTPADLWLGKGLGRFPNNYFLTGNPQHRPGDYRLGNDAENEYLTLTGGLHIGAEMFRVTQRVEVPGRQAAVSAKVRSKSNVTIQLEVCEKHLIYSQNCASKLANIKGAPGIWQDMHVQLEGAGGTRGAWYAPRFLAFSVAMVTGGGRVDLDNVELTTANGAQLLLNGDFSAGMAHWFSSSDRDHLPWHIKNLLMNELFDQGLVGMGLWLLLFLTALWRLSFGRARTHALAPALAAALIGFAVVGLFDSLLDVPRLAWLYYMLTLIGLTLPAPRTSATQAPRGV